MALSKPAVTLLADGSLALTLAAVLGAITLVESRVTPRPSAKEEYDRHDDLLGGIYTLRSKPNKLEWIAQFGGSRETEAAVQAGLDWLARHQSQDGSWSGPCVGPDAAPGRAVCEAGTACTVPGQGFAVAQTGLSILALQAAGNYDYNNSKYSGHVARGLYWLIDHQDDDGVLIDPEKGRRGGFHSSFMYEHAIGTFALAEACAVRKAQNKPSDGRQLEAAVMAVRFIETHQHNDGGWRYSTSKTEGSDTSVSGWVMLALKSAVEAGIPLDPATVPRTRDFFASCVTPDNRTAYLRGVGASSDAMTAVGILTNLLLLKEPVTNPVVVSSAAHLAGQAEPQRNRVQSGSPEFYTLYNATLALHQVGGSEWDRWNGAVRDAVVADQSKGPGCPRGSWDPRGTQGGHNGGRIYSTALGTLMLEVYYRFSRKPS